MTDSVVMTYCMITKEMTHVNPRIVDMDRNDDRKWLSTHIRWCVNNGKAVEVMSLAEYETERREAARANGEEV